MKRGFLVISAGVAAAYFVASSLWVSPAKIPRVHTHDQLDLAQDLKLVSEHSPYCEMSAKALVADLNGKRPQPSLKSRGRPSNAPGRKALAGAKQERTR